MKTKYFSLPVEFTENKVFSLDDDLIPVDIKVMHNGLNLNNTYFSDEVIEDAKETLKNKPILGYIKKQDGSDNIDFGGHEFEIVLTEDDVKIVALERPLGVIPETNNYAIQEIDDKKYVVCRGYLWREYLNDAYEILKENPNKSVSMEIAVDDYEVNSDGTIDVKKYRYLGITILGDDLTPAMQGAELNVIGHFSKNKYEEFYNKIEELNKRLNKYSSSNTNNEGGEQDLEETSKDDFVESVDGDKEEQPEEAFDNQQNTEETVENHNHDTKHAEDTGFEEIVDNNEYEEDKTPSLEDYKNLLNELEELKEKYNTLKQEHKELKQFKEDVLRQRKQAEIDEVFNKYSSILNETDMEDLRDEAINIGIEELEKELSYRVVQKKFNFAKIDKKDETKIIIKDSNDDKEPYGSASIYFNK